jgi:demethylmenaquinone methyltransferase/2-methoxy-6-polyprenyl-1,4-benzoquinol methylase
VKNNLSKENIYLIFNQIATTYDKINKVLSLGVDQLWRKALCRPIPRNVPLSILDLATGTGDQAFEILRKRPLVSITGVDKAKKMLDVASQKAKRSAASNVHFVEADAADLPFKDSVFDYVTLSFGIRNFSSLEDSMKEILRVLKNQGSLLILEFGVPKNTLLRSCYFFYLRKILPKIGGFLSKHTQAYKYLNESIEEFPSGDSLCHLLQKNGFDEVKYTSLSFGIVNLYTGRKNND